MAGKYEKNRTNKRKQNRAGRKAPKRKSGKGIVAVIVILLLILVAALVVLLTTKPGEAVKPMENTRQTMSGQETGNIQPDSLEDVSVNLGRQLKIRDIGSYTGIYMEDGTDELVSGVLMIIVENISKNTIQYAEIDMEINGEAAHFSLSTLPAGESVVVLEKSRMAYPGQIDYAALTAESNNVAVSEEPLNMHEDKLRIQALNGVINVTNISGEEIPNDISIYYKNSADDLYYGGITYRVTLTGGIKPGELKQIMASHYNQNGSRILFVTFGA